MTGGPTLSEAERIDWLQLIRSENVGPVTFNNLLARYGSARAAIEALPELARRGGRAKPIRIAPRAAAERELAGLAKIGARLIARGEPGYPVPLAAISDAPPLIAVRGRADLLGRPMIAMVGTRNASTNGRRFAAALARDIGANGFVVVSGLARGIDAAAHEGALATGTVAVVAGGVDVVYPRENDALTTRIAAEGGAIVAEQPLGLQPQARHFPHRNRLISGLSRAVVVVEAALRSGSLITARLAAEQGRDVLAVPGSPLDPRARGSNSLIKDGAWLVEGVDDVLAALGPLGGALSPIGEPLGSSATAPSQARAPLASSPVSQPQPTPTAGLSGDGQDLATERAKILELLSYSPATVDELGRRAHLSPAALAAILLELELAGRVERQTGGQISLIISGL